MTTISLKMSGAPTGRTRTFSDASAGLRTARSRRAGSVPAACAAAPCTPIPPAQSPMTVCPMPFPSSRTRVGAPPFPAHRFCHTGLLSVTAAPLQLSFARPSSFRPERPALPGCIFPVGSSFISHMSALAHSCQAPWMQFFHCIQRAFLRAMPQGPGRSIFCFLDFRLLFRQNTRPCPNGTVLPFPEAVFRADIQVSTFEDTQLWPRSHPHSRSISRDRPDTLSAYTYPLASGTVKKQGGQLTPPSLQEEQ